MYILQSILNLELPNQNHTHYIYICTDTNDDYDLVYLPSLFIIGIFFSIYLPNAWPLN